MLNTLWPLSIIISFVYGSLTGKSSEITQSIFSSTSDAVQLCISLLRVTLLLEWNYPNCLSNKYNGKNF